jgi:hypothetical protein
MKNKLVIAHGVDRPAPRPVVKVLAYVASSSSTALAPSTRCADIACIYVDMY